MSSFVSDFTVDDVKVHMGKLAALITPNEALIGSYLSEYFTKELWKCVKQRWWEVLLMEEPENLATLLSPHTFKTRTIWPLSLLAHRKAVHALALERTPFELSYALIRHILGNVSNEEYELSNNFEASNVCGLNSLNDSKGDIKDGQYKPLEHCYRRHVKPKKQHEISTLAQVIDAACASKGIRNVVDVGAGQGHLSRLLTYGYHKRVTTIEADGCHIPKAQKFDREVRRDIALGRTELTGKMLKKHKKNSSDGKKLTERQNFNSLQPTHTVAWISEDLDWKHFLNILNKSNISHPSEENELLPQCASNKDSNLEKSEFRNEIEKMSTSSNLSEEFLLTGLHACGDLSPTMMRVFVKCPQVQCLAAVSCCYMKLTTTSNRNGCSDAGYPMSQFARDRLKCTVSYEAREMACHFIDAYHQRLLDNQQSLRSHVHRAALQEIIISKSPHKVHDSVKLTFKKSHQLSFLEYAKKALERMGLDNSITSQQAKTAEERLAAWKEIVAFYTLRLSLAPVIESLILLDRLLYLLENGMNAAVVPIFDPNLSPRNFTIIAAKP